MPSVPRRQPPPDAERFVVIQPPPNVTGALHIGHALTFIVEDVMTRYHRMRGDDTLWLPGVDHASIGAQFVLDKIIAAEGESRASLGRERYLERMWQFMDETRPVIREQLRRFGASLDWSRERFTMDDGSARAVRVAFKRLWDAGLVYRGEALVNWCPRCLTTISDLENVHRDEPARLWTIRYHLERDDGTPDPDAWISVATTRPETLLGDTAVAVHPDDDRYRDLVGRHAILPFLGRRLPIVADEHVERAFGTGAVKVTPAHDPDDYEIAQRHGLPAITVLDEQARINAEGGDFFGRDRYEAREAILDRLREMGDLEAERPHHMVVGHCERCGTVVEPRLSVQWFIRVGPLAERALASVREGRTRILPPHFEKVYAHWMENIHDWAVGRQLWWGHRIPAWFCPDGHVTVSDAEAGPDACADCGRPAAELTQETDIFDTWFSSGLWPFSTLGWPDETPDMARFYPTSVMETGYDILFFWVARMMMLGLFCTDVEPFQTVYLHGMIRAEGGVKMSKTKGNSVDPLDMVDEIGADALRFALVSGSAPGSDQRLTQAKLDGGRNFTNKLWNAARFVLANRPEATHARRRPRRWRSAGSARAWPTRPIAPRASSTRSTWAATPRPCTRRHGATTATGSSRWPRSTCGARTPRPTIEPPPGARPPPGSARLLRLLHPLMPFVTEEIWQALREAAPDVAPEPLLVTAPWPEPGRARRAGRGRVRRPVGPRARRAATCARRPGARPPRGSRSLIEPAGERGRGDDPRRRARTSSALARVRPVQLADGDARPELVASARLGVAWLGRDAEADRAARGPQRGAAGRARRGASPGSRTCWPTPRSLSGRRPRWSSASARASSAQREQRARADARSEPS